MHTASERQIFEAMAADNFGRYDVPGMIDELRPLANETLAGELRALAREREERQRD